MGSSRGSIQQHRRSAWGDGGGGRVWRGNCRTCPGYRPRGPGSSGAFGGACGYLFPGPANEVGQFLGGKLGELSNLPSQHSLERQFGVMPDPKFGPVMIIGGDEAA